MSSHASKVACAIDDLTAAITADDPNAAYAACADFVNETTAVHKAKSAPHPKAATATSTAADADVVTACNSCTAALQASAATPQPATPAGPTPAVSGFLDSAWALFKMKVVPALIEWALGLFSSGTAPAPNPVP